MINKCFSTLYRLLADLLEYIEIEQDPEKIRVLVKQMQVIEKTIKIIRE